MGCMVEVTGGSQVEGNLERNAKYVKRQMVGRKQQQAREVCHCGRALENPRSAYEDQRSLMLELSR